jgi:hypothetical protein
MKNSIGNRDANKARWQERVRQADKHPEGLSAYCRANNVSLGALNYWRNKGRPKLPTVARRPAFIPIQVMAAETEVRSPSLPDAKWLADLIRHLAVDPSRSCR